MSQAVLGLRSTRKRESRWPIGKRPASIRDVWWEVVSAGFPEPVGSASRVAGGPGEKGGA